MLSRTASRFAILALGVALAGAAPVFADSPPPFLPLGASIESDRPGAAFGVSGGTAGDVNGDGYSDLVVGADGYTTVNAGDGAVFLYLGTSDGLSTEPVWAAFGDGENAALGASVHAAGDVNGDGYADIVAGAPGAGASGEGAAYVWFGGPDGPAFPPDWSIAGSAAGASLGIAVAFAGDVNGDGYADLALGADDSGASGEGAVYVFHGGVSGPAPTPTWSFNGTQPGEMFGFAVATAGDVNADGFADLAVGAPGYAAGAGRVRVFHGSAGGLSLAPDATLDGTASGSFGASVATAGDADGDGYADLLAGAPDAGDQAAEGVVYLYRGGVLGLGASPAWSFETNSAGAHLGFAVGPAGDVNGDGYADIIAGAPDIASGAGAAYVFLGGAAGPSNTPVATFVGAHAGARLGAAVFAAGDADGDGFADLFVGAPGYSNGQSGEGRVLVYRGGARMPGAAQAILQGNQTGADFGLALAGAGDVNGDGFADVAVAAKSHDNPQLDEGRVFVYHGAPGGVVAAPAWSAESDQSNARFGSSVAFAGDVNADGYEDLIVGAQFFDAGEVNEGRAFLYYGSASGLSPAAGWTAEANQAHAYLGIAVAGAGDVNGDGHPDVVVGASGWDGSNADEGAIFVFNGSPDGLGAAASFSTIGGRASAALGSAVASAGDVNGDGFADVIAGAPTWANGNANEGRVAVYFGSPEGVTASGAWTFESNVSEAKAGFSVASAGDVNGDGYADIAVGAPTHAGDQFREGRALVFYGSAAGLPASPSWIGEGNQSLANFGVSVAPAGDVNHDGYADLLVGANFFNTTKTYEGKVFLYLGGPGGLSAEPAWTAAGGQTDANLGASVAAAGDMNGDGVADFLVGGPHFHGDQIDEGFAFVYLGNRGGVARPVNALRWGFDRVLHPWTTAYSGTRYRMKSVAALPFGRGRASVEWEIAPFDAPFTGVSTIEPAADTASGDAHVAPVVVPEPDAYRHRARLRFDPATTPYGLASPWSVGGQPGEPSGVHVRTDCPGGCLIDDACYRDGTTNPDNVCLVCDQAADPAGWSDNNGQSCDDGAWCNGADACQAGTCSMHTGDPCGDDGTFCNGVESCDESLDACVHSGDPCPDDGLFCNGVESCDEENSECAVTDDPCPDDGEYCNGVESCNESTDACVTTGNPCGDDGLYCNGAEQCDEQLDLCAHTGDPCDDDGFFCNGAESCDEDQKACVHSGDPCGDDGVFCNGDESCDEGAGACVSSGDPCEQDGEFCNGAESCDEDARECVSAGDPCEDDGLWCNGEESCDENGDECVHAGDPCGDDGVFCNGDEVCDESVDECTHSGDPCAEDGIFCNGVETCDEDLSACVSPGDPCGDDGLWCNGDEYCDEAASSCAHTGRACPDDGYFCNGPEVCLESEMLCVSEGDPCEAGDTCDESADACETILGDDDDDDDDDDDWGREWEFGEPFGLGEFGDDDDETDDGGDTLNGGDDDDEPDPVDDPDYWNPDADDPKDRDGEKDGNCCGC
ncbi:FG-GAP-like repeat-containing protein [bacterium]|nr:FG-GAP-like repeat-containing protein [bacterium]